MARLLLALRDPLMTIALDVRNAPLPPQTGLIKLCKMIHFDKVSLRRVENSNRSDLRCLGAGNHMKCMKKEVMSQTCDLFTTSPFV